MTLLYMFTSTRTCRAGTKRQQQSDTDSKQYTYINNQNIEALSVCFQTEIAVKNQLFYFSMIQVFTWAGWALHAYTSWTVYVVKLWNDKAVEFHIIMSITKCKV